MCQPIHPRVRIVAEEPSIQVRGRLVRVARLGNEWFADVRDPRAMLEELGAGVHGRVDLFTFWQRPPKREPLFEYHWEPEFVAALPLTSYDAWWNRQIDGKTRNLVRKGQKKGLTVDTVPFNDNLVDGIAKIFNETPVRQGRRFWHYGKSFAQIRTEMADRPEQSIFIGAYLGKELVGFVKLLLLEEYAMMVEIISKVRHRDKAPNNLLVAAAVRECAKREVALLTYSTWGVAGLAEFKQNNGFRPLALPRFYIALTALGRITLHLNLHRGLPGVLPLRAMTVARALRRQWHAAFKEGPPRQVGHESEPPTPAAAVSGVARRRSSGVQDRDQTET